MTANQHRGEIEVTLGGKKMVMRPTFEAIVEIEAATNTGIVLLARRIVGGDLGMTDMTAIISAGLRAAGEPASHDKVGQMVFDAGVMSLIGPVGEFLTNALRGGAPPGEAEATDAEAT